MWSLVSFLDSFVVLLAPATKSRETEVRSLYVPTPISPYFGAGAFSCLLHVRALVNLLGLLKGLVD